MAVDLAPDDVGVTVEDRDEVKSLAGEAGVGHECPPDVAGADDAGIPRAVGAEDAAQLSDEFRQATLETTVGEGQMDHPIHKWLHLSVWICTGKPLLKESCLLVLMVFMWSLKMLLLAMKRLPLNFLATGPSLLVMVIFMRLITSMKT